MSKEEYLAELQEIIEDKMYIGNSIEDLESETSQNMWSISMSQQLANEFTTVDEIKDFLCKVINKRSEQLSESNSKNGMIFYLWFDKLSGRLRFNLISDIHLKLPFKCEIQTIEVIDSIINEFLTYPYHDGIPFEEATDEDDENEVTKDATALHVFLYPIENFRKAKG